MSSVCAQSEWLRSSGSHFGAQLRGVSSRHELHHLLGQARRECLRLRHQRGSFLVKKASCFGRPQWPQSTLCSGADEGAAGGRSRLRASTLTGSESSEQPEEGPSCKGTESEGSADRPDSIEPSLTPFKLLAVGLGLALAFLLPSISKTSGSISLSTKFLAAHAAADTNRGARSPSSIRPDGPAQEGAVPSVTRHSNPQALVETQASRPEAHADFPSVLRNEDRWPRKVEEAGRLGIQPDADTQAAAPRWPPLPRPAVLRRLNQPTIQYAFDVMMERHPTTYVMLLFVLCGVLVGAGGFLFQTFRNPKNGRESLWDSWSSVVSSSSHLRESTMEGRVIGFMLTLGGLFFYSLLTSTLTANFKLRMEWLREGAHSQVMERGHLVVGGINHHLPTLLRQLSKSHEFAVRDGTARTRKQVVLLLAEQSRKETEKLLAPFAKEFPHLTLLIRSGSLTSTGSFKRVAADNARSVILLAAKDDYYDADADAVTSVLALLPLIKAKPTAVVVEVSKATTARLLHSVHGPRVSAVEDLSAKLFVQCCRQPGLVDVYCNLLDHSREVINLRSFPSLAGTTYGVVRRAFKEAVICGVIRHGRVNFHPPDEEPLLPQDLLAIIAPKHTQRTLPPQLQRRLDQRMASPPPTPMGPPGTKGHQLAAKAVALETSGPMRSTHKSRKHLPRKRLYKTSDWTTAKAERILLLGWRLGVPDMIREYDDYVGPGSELVVLAKEPVEEREALMRRMITTPLRHLSVVHKEGNPMSGTDVRAAILDHSSLFHNHFAQGPGGERPLEPVPFSISIISGRMWRSGDRAKPDKQCLYSLLLADSICRDGNIKVHSLAAEFQDMKLAQEVLSIHPTLQYIGTSDLMGLVTAQVTEHSELNAVWTELLNSWGDEIYVKDIMLYKDEEETPTFAELAERANSRKEVALGIRRAGKVILNPCPKDVPLSLQRDDSLIVISEFK